MHLSNVDDIALHMMSVGSDGSPPSYGLRSYGFL
jgi:hypothetical protein